MLNVNFNFQEFTDELIKDEAVAEDQKDAFKVIYLSLVNYLCILDIENMPFSALLEPIKRLFFGLVIDTLDLSFQQYVKEQVKERKKAQRQVFKL